MPDFPLQFSRDKKSTIKNESVFWTIPTFSLTEKLDQFASFPENKKLCEEISQFTIVDKAHTFTDAKSLARKYRSKKPPNTLIVFKPQRLMLHEAIVQASTDLQLDGPEDTKRIVKLIMDNINTKNKHVYYRLSTIYDAKGEEYYQKISHSIIKDIVAATIDTLVKQKKVKRIVLPQRTKERHLFLITGGPGSGKGTIAQSVLLDAKRMHNINPLDIVTINSDIYKNILFEKPNRSVFWSQITYPEASLIKKKIIARLAQLSAQEKCPHVLLDQAKLHLDQIKFGLKNNGHVHSYIVSTKAESAVKRAYLRGKIQGRFEHTEGLLRCHRDMYSELMTVIKSINSMEFDCTLFDNNVALHAKPIIVMKINAKANTIKIYDKKLLADFTQKAFINTKAKCKKHLYTESASKTNPLSMFYQCCRNTQKYRLVLISPHKVSQYCCINYRFC